MWVEIIDRDTLADPEFIYPYAWLIYKGKGEKFDFSQIRVYNGKEDCTVTQHVNPKQLRELTDKEVFVLSLKDKTVMDMIKASLSVVY
jgi:hypothetical protein